MMAVAEKPRMYCKSELGRRLEDESSDIERQTYKSYERSINGLLKEGYLSEVDGRLELGDVVCPPLRLRADEVKFLLTHLADEMRTSPYRNVLRQVAEKLPPLIFPPSRPDEDKGKRLTYRLFKGRVPVEDQESDTLVRLLHDAAVLERRVELIYLSPTLAEPVTCIVDPLGVVYSWFTDAWYLVGRPAGAEDVQYFRVDRIRECRPLDEGFEYPDGFDLAKRLEKALGVDGSPPVKIKVRFYPVVNVIEKVRFEMASRIASGASFDETPGGCVYTDEVAGLNEAAAWLRQYGSAAEVLEPPELRSMMRDTALGLTALYSRAAAPAEEVVS
jgi:predicted DNA-binding transcriptional regulator YafY